MISTEGMISVAEASKRLGRSVEQVRRYLREGKLPGQRIGGQWFIREESLRKTLNQSRYEQRMALLRRIIKEREEIRARLGHGFNIEELIDESREGLR
jgi:excisionase family DNA binding protein